MTLNPPELSPVPHVGFDMERRAEMRSCSYDRVFLVPTAKDLSGWRPGNDNRQKPTSKRELPRISIAWWLVPCVLVWAASALVFA